jgi:hypothetical protein
MALAIPTIALSQDIATMQKAQELGTVLGAEGKCGFSYDQDAISDWIDANVPPDDMSFASMLDTMTRGTQFQMEDMSQSSLTAQCRAVERTAKHFGFVK